MANPPIRHLVDRDGKKYDFIATIEGMDVLVSTVDPDTEPSAEGIVDHDTGKVTIYLNIPRGKDGASPTAEVSKVGKIATVKIVNSDGTVSTVDISDGEQGVSVSHVLFDGYNNLVITLSDGTETTFDGIAKIMAAANEASEKASAAAVEADNVNATIDGTSLTITSRDGTSTTVNTKGEKGADGYTPVRGVDYWTAEDVAIVDDAIGKATDAAGKANEAAAEASNVNVTIDGTKLSVTDREGTSTTVDTKGEKGDKLTFADLTDADKAELSKPATEAAEVANEAAEKAEKAVATIPSDYQTAISAMMKAGSNTEEDYLKSGDDLNNISKACTRISTGSSVTSGISNVPEGVTDQFIIHTLAADQDPWRLAQILRTIDSTGTREFTRTGAGSSWTEWNEIHTPVRGVDYWTDADIAVIKAYIDAQGVLPPDIGYEGLSKLVKSGEASRYLPVGSQIITALSGNNFEVPSFAWDVVHHFDGSDDDHPLVTLESGEQVKGMMLQAHRTVPWAIVWDPRQAAIAVAGDMPAGTYHFTVKVTVKWSSGIAGEVGEKTYQFTTTQALSSGAQLMYSGGESTAPTSASLQVFANNTSSTAVETCALSLGSSGTDLGVMTDATPSTNSQAYAKLNNIQRMIYGSNRWSTSQERVALNGVGTIVQEGTEFDRSWSLVGSTGLLGCLPEEFVSVLGSIARLQEPHPWDGGEVETVYDKMFPISAREHYFSNYLSATSDGYKAEGVPLDYWKQLAVASGRTSAWAGWNTYPELITYDSVALTTARYVWLRSAHRSATSAHAVGRVSTSGGVTNARAADGYFAAPACIIV